MSALRFGNEGQSLRRFVHRRAGKCDGPEGRSAVNRDGVPTAEGQSLEHLVHRGPR